jgi:hypothetical protein
MLRFTRMRLKGVQEQLLWNALYESFGVHARNLYDFLRDEKDSRNFKASDFVQNFELDDRNDVHGLMQTMYQQLLHLGKRRAAAKNGKIDVTDIEKIATWIEAGVHKFTAELQPPFRQHWKPTAADPAAAAVETYEIEPSTPQRSSSPTFSYTGYNKPSTGR